jgi:hypothetical protein
MAMELLVCLSELILPQNIEHSIHHRIQHHDDPVHADVNADLALTLGRNQWIKI